VPTRRAVTAAERLVEAREELRLYRWLCDVALAAWASQPATDPGPTAPASPEATMAGRWPQWQAPWVHERCRPVVLGH
jgi:hypothetical protein